MENIVLIILGICMIVLGAFNIRGNINSIHWYNRRKITEENSKQYGKVMGTGTLIMGITFCVTAIVQMVSNSEQVWYVALGGLIIGLVIMLYGQLKYNKGIF